MGIIVDKENRKEIAKRNYRLQPYFLAEARGITEIVKTKKYERNKSNSALLFNPTKREIFIALRFRSDFLFIRIAFGIRLDSSTTLRMTGKYELLCTLNIMDIKALHLFQYVDRIKK